MGVKYRLEYQAKCTDGKPIISSHIMLHLYIYICFKYVYITYLWFFFYHLYTFIHLYKHIIHLVFPTLPCWDHLRSPHRSTAAVSVAGDLKHPTVEVSRTGSLREEASCFSHKGTHFILRDSGAIDICAYIYLYLQILCVCLFCIYICGVYEYWCTLYVSCSIICF